MLLWKNIYMYICQFIQFIISSHQFCMQDFKETRSNSVDSAIESYLEALDWEDVVLSKLQIVQIHGVIGVRSELQFSKILLASSPSLKEISVFCNREITSFNEKMRIKQEFLQLPKKSQQAQLLWHDRLLQIRGGHMRAQLIGKVLPRIVNVLVWACMCLRCVFYPYGSNIVQEDLQC